MLVNKTHELFNFLGELSVRYTRLQSQPLQVRPICQLLVKYLVEDPKDLLQLAFEKGVPLEFGNPDLELFFDQNGFRGPYDKVNLTEFLNKAAVNDCSISIEQFIETCVNIFDENGHLDVELTDVDPGVVGKMNNDPHFVPRTLSYIVKDVIITTNPLKHALVETVLKSAKHHFEDLNCPCGSKKRPETCCLRDGYWYKIPKTVSVPLSDFVHPKCYASALGSCSQELSREDYLTKGVLKHIAKNEGSKFIKSGGQKWQKKGEKRIISYDSLKSFILCKHHNNGLSVFDAEAIRLFEALHTMEEDFKKRQSGKDFFLFNGEDIERWMLKVFIGQFLTSKTIIEVKHEWLEILIRNKPMPNGFGMYFIGLQAFVNSMAMLPIFSGNECIGAEFFIHNYKFIFLLANKKISGDYTYRPLKIRILNNGIRKDVHFSWKETSLQSVATSIKFNSDIKVRPEWDDQSKI